VPDECDLANCPPGDPACDDCNTNGVLDECDIASGTSLDVNGDGIPDECDSGPTWCLGDSNCDGAVDFSDIQCFVAALSGEAAWVNTYKASHGGADPPCPYAVNDLNGGGVEFTDIQPFVQHLGQPCDPM
jgi:hypothetical protein